MPKFKLPPVEELDDLDPDDLYDDLEDFISEQVGALDQVLVIEPSIDKDELLLMANTLIPLKEMHASILEALALLEAEMDTTELIMRLQPLEDICQKLLKNLRKSNEMIYLFDEIKTTRKKSKRVMRKTKRVHEADTLKQLESESDGLLDSSNFYSRIENFRAQGFNVDSLLAALKQMDKQMDKTRDALDGKMMELNGTAC